MNTLEVLILFSSSELGGAERSLTRMALVSDTVNYHLATLDGEGPWTDWVAKHGRKPLIFGQRNSSKHGRFRIRALWDVIQYARAQNIQVIYVCGLRAAFFLRLSKFLFSNTKIVHAIRWNPASNSRLDKIFRLIESFTSYLVDFYITNSQIAANTLIDKCRIPNSKVDVVHNGLSHYPEQIISIFDRPLQVLSVANLNPRKGHIEYLKVIKKVVEFVPKAKFVFVGRDDMNGAVQREILKSGLSANVTFEGFQSDVTHYYSKARMFVLPSLWGEGCPTSILESMSWGVPVIAYRVDGVPELVRNGVDGFLVPESDEAVLTEKIIELLKNDSLAASFSSNARQKVSQSFSLKHCANHHQLIFQKLMSRLGEAAEQIQKSK